MIFIFQITIEPDSDVDSDISELNTTTRIDNNIATSKSMTNTQSKKCKIDTIEQQIDSSSDEFTENFDEIDMTDASSYVKDNNKMDKADVKQNVLTLIDSKSSRVADDEDKFGTMVSSKLLLMSPLQRLISQKIISEILLKGQLGMLKNSLSPVLVSGYMKSISNGATNVISTEHLLYNSENDNNDDDSDPLMFQAKHEDNRQTNFEMLEEVKHEMSWSDDDQNGECIDS